jgi:hypothetical protein
MNLNVNKDFRDFAGNGGGVAGGGWRGGWWATGFVFRSYAMFFLTEIAARRI